MPFGAGGWRREDGRRELNPNTVSHLLPRRRMDSGNTRATASDLCLLALPTNQGPGQDTIEGEVTYPELDLRRREKKEHESRIRVGFIRERDLIVKLLAIRSARQALDERRARRRSL